MTRLSIPIALPIYLLLPVFALPQTSIPTAAKKSENCVLEGVVVGAEDSSPLKKSHVIVSSETSREKVYGTVTDADGRFALKDVAPGRYRVSAEHNGFETQEYGGKGRDTILALHPGQQLQGLLFRLVRAAAIMGRIVDEDGDPIPRVDVQALRPLRFRGKQQLSGTSAKTDDTGQYRIFGLSPGAYYLSATRRDFRYRMLQADSGENRRYLPTYYPGTNDPTQAERIELPAGEEVQVNLTVLSTRGVRIRGRVINAVSGGRAQGASVSLSWRNPRLGILPTGMNRYAQDGWFEIEGVPPGSYILSGGMHVDREWYSAQQSIEVGTDNIDGIELVVTKGLLIRGRVTVEGAAVSTISTVGYLRILLSNENEFGSGVRSEEIKPDGTFLIRNVAAGTYMLDVAGRPKNTYIKSIYMGNEHLSGGALVLSSGKNLGFLDIVLSGTAATIDGIVRDENDRPFVGATIARVPEKHLRERFDLYDSVTTDQYGRFTMSGIAPGQYTLFAWDKVESDDYEDPTFLKRYDEQGEQVQLLENQHATASLKVIKTGSQGN